MKSIQYKFIEFILLFVLIPTSFAFNYPVLIKLILMFLGFCYIIYILLKVEKNKFKINPNLHWKRFWKNTAVMLVAIATLTTLFVYFTDASQLFIVLLNKPLLWLAILFIYSLFSVYPQELIFRTFFFQRYASFFKSEKTIILVNALVFSMAHLLFRNGLVLLLTFIGGILFALTYKKTKSTLLVSIEHAIYGCWLFTVGMGSMLGFPS